MNKCILNFGFLNRKASAYVALMIGSLACVPVGGPKIQNDVVEMKNRMGSLESTVNRKTSTQIAAATAKIFDLEQEVNRLKGKVDTLEVALKTGAMPGTVVDEFSAPTSLPSRVKELEEIVDQLQNKTSSVSAKNSSRLAHSKKAPTTAPAAVAVSSAKVSLKSLNTAFKKKNYSLVIDQADEVINTSKGHVKSEALYLKARSSHFTNKTREAALLFDAFINSKPKNKDDIAQAKLYLGDCFKKLGDMKTAKIYYKEVENNFKGTVYSKAAKKRLTKI